MGAGHSKNKGPRMGEHPGVLPYTYQHVLRLKEHRYLWNHAAQQ